MSTLENKVAIVTGASAGIGRESATQQVCRGWRHMQLARQG